MTDSTDPRPFSDLDHYLDLPRLASLALSADGARLVTTMATPNDERTAYVSSLWAIDPAGAAPARRLTRGGTGDSAPVWSGTGDLLFSRAASSDDDAPRALWALPTEGGEPRRVAHRAGGVGGAVAAGQSSRVVVAGDVLGSVDADERIRALRKDSTVSAVLHSGYPVRHWDHDLGPARTHLFALALDLDADADTDLPLTDATPTQSGTGSGGSFRDAQYDLSADGTVLVSTETVAAPDAGRRQILVVVDPDTGTRRTLIDDPDADVLSPVVSPDGSRVAYLRESRSTPELAPRVTLHVVDTGGGASTRWAADWDRWPTSAAWLPDASAVLVTADDAGRAPVFVVTATSATALTHDDAAYTDVVIAPDGSTAFALRASYASPPHPVRIELADGRVTALRAPTPLPDLPGDLVEVSTTTDAGVTVRAWLARPAAASADAPAPLVLWVHGGPLSSWNTWSWRWNPWLLVAQGYAVLLPDPALSTGYGQDFVQRGWGAWGTETYQDIMAVTDAAELRPEIDASRTAMMGGSFGGYMANWIAGHTDRFAAIVSHAGLWALDQFGPTTDDASYWIREMTPEMAFENSPHLFVSDIVTPMLIIHGDKDYRVPIGEALRLWFELLSESSLPADADGATVHRFLVFPSETHWILSPQHAKVWYQVVTAFLSTHVLGEEASMPDVLAPVVLDGSSTEG